MIKGLVRVAEPLAALEGVLGAAAELVAWIVGVIPMP